MIIQKIKCNYDFSYKTYDEETEHHILFNDEFEDLECDYIDNDNELLTYMFNVLDDDTELLVLNANEVA